MQSPSQDGPVIPVLIQKNDGAILRAAVTNTKGRLKSLEQGEPWVLDGENGRLLPLSHFFPGLSGKGRYLERIDEIPGGIGFVLKKGIDLELAEPGDRTPGTTGNPVNAGHASDKHDPGESGKTAAQEAGSGSDASESRIDANTLYELEHLIRERKLLMPEGSYTTHLFAKGLSKIRKKTGEEAIELLLAEKPDEIAGEAADLLYHMLVLLVALDLPLARIFEELKKR